MANPGFGQGYDQSQQQPYNQYDQQPYSNQQQYPYTQPQPGTQDAPLYPQLNQPDQPAAIDTSPPPAENPPDQPEPHPNHDLNAANFANAPEMEPFVKKDRDPERKAPVDPEDDPHRITICHTSCYKDHIEKATTLLLMVIGLFRLIMACLLAVFVPQYCYPFQTGASATRNFEGAGECTFLENFTQVTPYNIFVLVWNFATLVVCILHRGITLRREAFMVDQFDVNPQLPADQIKEVLKTNLALADELADWNKKNHLTSTLFFVFNLLNFLFSAVLVFLPANYAGFRTVTVFFTNISLVGQLIFSDYFTSRSNVRQNLAVSMVNRDARFYNCRDHRRDQDLGLSKPQLVDMSIQPE